MTSAALTDGLLYAEPFFCALTFALICWRKQLSQFRSMGAFLAIRVLSECFGVSVLHMAGRQIEAHTAYQVYFYTYWGSYLAEAVCAFGIIYDIYNLAMAPLHGLQRLGKLMFRWAAGIACAIAIAMAFSPHVTGVKFAVRFASQLQQTGSVLTLCMLLFVCLAIRPMGLSYRSKIFGVCLGLGVLAATDLARSAWISQTKLLIATQNIIGGVAVIVSLLIWTAYFALPEPKRRMIVLPTTSPFLRWNQISLALGDNPGFVAVGEVHPEMFAPAELEIMKRASVKMRQAIV